jgi:predicted dehydrogenase
LALRIIQVGLGGWGYDWLTNVVLPSADFELAACVDVDASVLERVQARGVPPNRCFTAVEKALETVDCEAVLITTTLPYHVPVALAALKAGKHVLVEKPFAPTLEDARQAVDLAATVGKILMVSQNYRFYPAVRAVMALLGENAFGPVHSVNLDFRRYANKAPVPGHRHYALTQPLLMDMAIHHFDLMRGVLRQEPAVVSCTTWNPSWSKFVEPPVGAATITFDGGAVVSYRGSWISAGPATPWAGEWHMECEGGEIVWTSRADIGISDATGLSAERVVVRPLGKRPRPVELPTLAHFDRAGALHAFAQAIQTGQEPETSGRANLGSLALMLATIEASKSGLPVRFG